MGNYVTSYNISYFTIIVTSVSKYIMTFTVKFNSPFSVLLEKFDKMPLLFKDNPNYKLETKQILIMLKKI
jgi:hypothetical protein